MNTAPKVYLIDDDASVRKSVARLLRIAAYQVEAYSSADEFLDTCRMAEHGCIVLDLRMPGLSGEGLQDRLRTMKEALPVIIITGHGDVKIRDSMIKKGAVAFLTKPFDDQELLDAIEAAFVRNRREVRERSERNGS
ncbi:MAG: response regulator transcription factor [Gemmatimonadetes bacterium]|nr:response regulator transcription factor [Gemmatimonadota bacterium]